MHFGLICALSPLFQLSPNRASSVRMTLASIHTRRPATSTGSATMASPSWRPAATVWPSMPQTPNSSRRTVTICTMSSAANAPSWVSQHSNRSSLIRNFKWNGFLCRTSNYHAALLASVRHLPRWEQVRCVLELLERRAIQIPVLARSGLRSWCTRLHVGRSGARVQEWRWVWKLNWTNILCP